MTSRNPSRFWCPAGPEGEFILFCRDRDPKRELWDGRRAGPEGAVADHAADDAFPIDDIDDILPGLLERSERVYYAMGASDAFDGRLMEWMHRLQSNRQRSGAPDELVSLDHLLHEMRLFKSRAEIRIMQRSARLAVAAHKRAMTVCKPGLHEYELEAEFHHEFARHGARCSYTPIIAAGVNACVLHYTENRAPLGDGDLVLIDAGCEYRMLRIRRDPHVSGQRPLQRPTARALRHRPRGPRRRGGKGPPRQSLERSPRCRRARDHAGAEGTRHSQRTAGGTAEEGSLQALLHAQDRGTGWASTCTTWAITRSRSSGGCWSRGWS